MTDEQINVAIATHLGITRGVPDFTGDLNEIHEAEKTLIGSLQSGYIYELWDVTNAKTIGAFENINATARQRAEAFLRTLGKWEEGE
jgi:hypothetical protein